MNYARHGTTRMQHNERHRTRSPPPPRPSQRLRLSRIIRMRNRAEKHAVRWCHLTHQVNAGASVHSREPKARVVEVYPYFVSKRFINHSIIIKSCQAYPEHIVMCHNAKTGVTAKKTAAIHERQTRFALRHHQNTSSNKNPIFVFLPDSLAVRLLSSSFAFNFCKLQLSYLHI